MQIVCGFERRTVQSRRSAHVEISFIDRSHLNLRRECAQDSVDLFRAFAVTLWMPVDKDGMRTLLGRSPKRHCGVDSELASFVRRSGDNTTLVALSADNDCLSFQRGIVEFFHRNKESVHVDVEDGARKRGLLGSSHAARILAAAVVPVRSRCARTQPLLESASCLDARSGLHLALRLCFAD